MTSCAQTSSTSTAGGTVSVMKVTNASAAGPSATTTSSSQTIRITKAPQGESASVRRVEVLCKQEKANRIVAEAIARAKARGEKNLPRVLNQDELPNTQTSPESGGTLTVVSAAKKKSSGGSKKKSPVSGGLTPKTTGGANKNSKVKAPSGTTGVAGCAVITGNKSKCKTKPK